ncbi:MAG: type III-B CRISPR module-associated protein Cmr3 [Mariprofundaceae bacterium]
MSALFLKPLDVLYLRGNKIFGASGGDDAEAQMPPWPSVAAGAIRSRMLVDAGVNPAAFAKGDVSLTRDMDASLGTPKQPGTFRLARFTLARRQGDAEEIEPLLPLPADWLATGDAGSPRMHRLMPRPLPEGVAGSAALPLVPALRIGKQEKPCSGLFLTGQGLAAWLRDEAPEAAHVEPSGKLWQLDARLGIAMDANKRAAEEGRIYTSDAVALADGVGFLAEVSGAEGLLPQSGLLRLGGDGRGAAVAPASVTWPEPDWDAIAATGCFRLMLTSPGLFDDGWRPKLEDARLVAAAVNRAMVVSGWDLAAHAPKPAERCAPPGAVYWFEGFDGVVADLQAWVRYGLPCADKARCAEGFNACLIGNWSKERSDV